MRVRHPFARFSLPLAAMSVALAALALGSFVGTASAIDDVEGDTAEEAPTPPKPAPSPESAPAAPAVEVAIPAPAPAPPAADVAPPAASPTPAPEKKPYFRAGIHRLRLSVGYNKGDTVRNAGILAAPLTGEPGQATYPAAEPLSVELKGGPILNLGYAYFFDEKWGVDLGFSYFPSEIFDKEYDSAKVDAQLATTNLAQDQKDHLVARMAAHATAHDMSITTFDVNAARIFAPRSKWPVELAAGLGWSFASLGSTTIGDRVVYERLVTSRVVNPQDSAVVANDIPAVPLPYDEQGCLADNDPCIEMTEHGGLTWNLAATLHHPFTTNLMLDFGLRIRVTAQALDPGDQYVTPEFGVGLSYLFGGK